MPTDRRDDLMLTWAALLAQSVGWVPAGRLRSTAQLSPALREATTAPHSVSRRCACTARHPTS